MPALPLPERVLALPVAQGERTLAEIITDLSKPLPAQLLRTRRQGGRNITYSPWHTVNRLLDQWAPGWEGRVETVTITDKRIFVVYSLTIHASDGLFTRQATGTELLDCQFADPSSGAESMAFRRAAARFGLGLYLYNRAENGHG